VKVLLLNPPSFTAVRYVKEGICQGRATPTVWPPVTLAAIGAVCRRLGGFDVRLIDGNAQRLKEADLRGALRDFKADVVFLNTATPCFAGDLRSAELVKEVRRSARTVMIGTHASATARRVVASAAVDVVIRNEPERVARNLLVALKVGDDLAGVKGITYERDGVIVSNPDEDFIEDLDEWPWPDRDLLDNSLYVNPLTGKRFTVIRNSRGCPARCVFCVGFYYGKKWRTRSAANVVAELEECVTRHGVTDFVFNADLFTFDKGRVIELCREIVDRGLDITWVCNSRVDTIDEERLEWMERAGCQLVSLGIESASEAILAGAKKGIDREKIMRAVALFTKSRVKSLGYFVFGLPGETRETAEATIRFALELPLDYASFYTAVPFPGTPLAAYLRDNGLIKPADWSRYDDSQCDVYDLPDLTGEELRRLVRRGYLRWYGRPRQIARAIGDAFTPVGLKRNLSLLGSFVNLSRRACGGAAKGRRRAGPS